MDEPENQPDSKIMTDVPEVTVSHVRRHEVQDVHSRPVAFKFAFVGVGQCGGRIAAAFHALGYRRVCAINTDHADLATLPVEIPKLDLQTGGAGKDPRRGLAAVAANSEAVTELLTRSIGDEPDFIIVCLGLAGGTGSGASPQVIKIARQYMHEHDRPPSRVGAIVALPHPAEGQTPCRNALHAFHEILHLGVSPFIVLDNKRIQDMFEVGVTKFYDVANTQTASLLHVFNRLAGQDSSILTFDQADFASVLDSGLCVLGGSPVTDYSSPADISEAIRKHLAATVLAEVDLSQGRTAACIFVGSEKILGSVPMSFFDGGFSMFNRMMIEDSVVHRGIYTGTTEDLRCFSMLAGLPAPKRALERIASEARISNTDEVARHLGL